MTNQLVNINNYTATRKFRAFYSLNGEENYRAVVKLFPLRYADIAWELTLINTLKGKITTKQQKKVEEPILSSAIQIDKENIAKVLEVKPNILKGVKRITHSTKLGETLSSIALKYNTTEQSIISLNPHILLQNSLKPNIVLTIDKIVDLPELDIEINFLKFYFDYLLNYSSLSKIAKSKEEKYKEPLFESKNSIYNELHLAYITYHDNMGHILPNKENEFINTLYVIADEVNDRFNLGGKASIVLTYADFKSYCLEKLK